MYPRCDLTSQMPYHCDYPTFQMRGNSAAYEPWSYGAGNYGYRIPDGYNHFPPYHCSGYPHPYHPPPLPYFHDACCPTMFYNMHHPLHYAPPPNYSMELPTYDYDKKLNGRCPYHLCCWGGDAKEKTYSFPPAQPQNLPYPIVANTAKQMHGGPTEPGVMSPSDQPNLDGSRFQFPIIWIPYKPEEAGKKDHAEEQTTPTQEVSPSKSSKEGSDSNLAQATTMVGNNDLNHCKSIPVKQLDEPGNNRTVSKQPENELAKNNPEGGYKRSKLPPVCLRIEPILKKKNGSGKSRSLSPPKRGKPEEMVTDSSATKDLKKDMKTEGEREHGKLAQVADAKTKQAEIPCAGKELGNSEAMDSKDQSMDAQLVEVVKRKVLTEVEAALMIQAAYRGYEVRKWEPIKKLKAIGKVKEELNEVRSRMKAMEFSSYSSSDKERSLLGEMIMNLLLKLDTIQGLDPVARDVRKSTAKELVNLQEQVDSFVNNKRDVVNSPQIETETTGSEDAKVFEGGIGATKEEEEGKEVIALEEALQADDGGVIDLEATKKEEEGKEESTCPKMQTEKIASVEVKVCEDEVEATKGEEEEKELEKGMIALEEAAQAANGGIIDDEATKKEEEGKGEATSPHMEMKTVGSEEVKVCEDEVEEASCPQMEVKTIGRVEEASCPQMKVKTIGSEKVKFCADQIEATEKEDGMIALEEAAQAASDGISDDEAAKEGEDGEKEAAIALEESAESANNREKTYHEATKKEEKEEQEEVTALEEAAQSADNVGVTGHVEAKKEEEGDKEEVSESANNEGWATSFTITNSGEMLELKEEKGSVNMEMKDGLMREADKDGDNEDEVTTIMSSTSSGMNTWGKEEKEVEALVGDADNGGARDEGNCIITSGTKIELKEEEKREEEKVRMIMEQLVEKGKEQLEVIRELSKRVVMLEKKLATSTKRKRAGARTRARTGTRKSNLK